MCFPSLCIVYICKLFESSTMTQIYRSEDIVFIRIEKIILRDQMYSGKIERQFCCYCHIRKTIRKSKYSIHTVAKFSSFVPLVSITAFVISIPDI